MYPRSNRFGRGVGGLCHLTRARTFSLVLMSFALLILVSPLTAKADLVWEQLWFDDFEQSLKPGWALTTYGRGDVLEVREEVTTKGSNKVLYGEALEPSSERSDHGFLAQIPTLKELGLDDYAPTYVIRFKYRIDSGDFCWTMPLASPDMSLVITECGSDGMARLGMVDDTLGGFTACTSLTIGPNEWHDFRVVVKRDAFTGNRVARLFVDGVEVGSQLRTGEPLFDRISFVDLPIAPVNVDAEGTLPLNSCFGKGSWDDVRVMALQPVTPSDRRFGTNIRVYPNPANPATTIQMALDQATRLDVNVYDVRGRFVQNLFSGVHPAGQVSLLWRGQDSSGHEVASGAYLVKVTTPYGSQVTRATLTR